MKFRIIVRGPVLSMSGYGEQSRFALRALRKHEDKFDIHIVPELRHPVWLQYGLKKPT